MQDPEPPTAACQPAPGPPGGADGALAELVGYALAWLAGGARDVSWAVRSIPGERWGAALPTSAPGQPLAAWPAARHARHLALYEALVGLPAVRAAAGQAEDAPGKDGSEFARQDAAWGAEPADERAMRGWLDALGAARYEMLGVAESAPDNAWAARHGLGWLLVRSRQHELEHLAALGRLALALAEDEARPPAPVPAHATPADLQHPPGPFA